MGFFDKTDIVLKQVDEKLAEVNRNSEEKLNIEVRKIQNDMLLLKDKQNEDYKTLSESVAILFQRLAAYGKQIEEAAKEESSVSDNPDVMTFKQVERAMKNIKYFSVTRFKYYLYENGILDLIINDARDTYYSKSVYDSTVNEELLKYVIVSDNKISFSKEIIDYLNSNTESVVKSIAKYNAKNKQYNESKKNISEKHVQNYKDEIKKICGTDASTNWNRMYGVFQKTYPNFVSDYKKYITKNPNLHGKYDMPKVDYVIQIMKEGDLLLKIACELYVN